MKQGTYRPAVENIMKIIEILSRQYPQAKDTSLNYKDPFQLLIATILAAQSTDKQVNKITPSLFEKFSTPQDFARADTSELEEAIKSTGFFRNKAKSIKQCSRKLVDKFGGDVPRNIDDLTLLPGVGRKTANVVLGNAFGQDAIIVDTHMKRISTRLGLSANTNPDKIEQDLMEIIPEGRRTDFSHKIVAFGRTVCLGRNPKCAECRLLPWCRYGQANA
ncbi:MAG: endonuclease III [Actinomycetota bacterium]